MRTVLSLSLFLPALIACEQRADVGNLSARDAGVQPRPTPTEQVGTFCGGFYQRYCEASPRCCSDPTRAYATVAACVQEQQSRCAQDLLASPVIADGALAIDEGALPDFYRALDAEHTSCLVRTHAPPLVGTLASGADCSFSDQDRIWSLACQRNLTCIVERTVADPAGPRYVAHCGAPLAQGASCVVTSGDSGCGGDRYCAAGTCQARKASGEACQADGECVLGLGCEGQRCGPKSMNGSSPQSKDDYYCASGAPVCATRFNAEASGCSHEWQCQALYQVQCTPIPGGDDFTCECFTDTLPSGDFVSRGFCSASEAAQSAAARSGCGFPL